MTLPEDAGLLIYLATRADEVKAFFGGVGEVGRFLTFFSFVGALVSHLCFLDAYSPERAEFFRRWRNRLVKVAIVVALVAIPSTFIKALIPTRNEIALILGGQLTADAVTSEPVKDVAGKIGRLINKKLDEELAEKQEDKK